MAKTPAKYYIVEAEDLRKYGKAEGMTKEEAEAAITEIEDNEHSGFPYYIIKGVEIKPKFRL